MVVKNPQPLNYGRIEPEFVSLHPNPCSFWILRLDIDSITWLAQGQDVQLGIICILVVVDPELIDVVSCRY